VGNTKKAASEKFTDQRNKGCVINLFSNTVVDPAQPDLLRMKSTCSSWERIVFNDRPHQVDKAVISDFGWYEDRIPNIP